ncbi:hypothetical protein BJY24_000212 [Nocardia transvalensis]|uniref:Uncharacterized protein n=1 Tax=Nocardia transvalensis TaxID=37333 RepID=A0A7W9P8F8_9NOCA|nr:hypothetical protein [Nocardia transvalensis]MBB5911345.1 hypothetical protein [Nocardia transvalensis]
MTTTTERRSAPCLSGEGGPHCEVDGELTDTVARRILGAEHAASCARWLAAAAYLSAGLDDD